MARPIWNRRVTREPTIEDLCLEFLARGRAKNLSPSTIEWYERHARAFARWCTSEGIVLARELQCAHLDDFLEALHGTGAAANTVRGAAQTIKALSRFGFRKGHIPTEITRDPERLHLQSFSYRVGGSDLPPARTGAPGFLAAS